jgi:hypothetical protein
MSIAVDQSVLQYEPRMTVAERAARPVSRRAWIHWLLLLAIILVGGVMRFSYLDKPPIWFDEAATFGRTCGTYQQMLDALEEAGFGPLHYHLEWWIKNGLPLWGRIESVRVPATVMGDGIVRVKKGAGKDGKVDARNLVPTHQLVSGGITMTPLFLRLVPAICGTLMIPAMYWLARELTGRRGVALLAALLTASSAYLLNYSRDAKMYADLWLFVALSIASLLWWLRSRRFTAWLCWIIASTAMIGTHLLGLAVIAIELIVVLTARDGNWLSFAMIPVMPGVWVMKLGRRFFGWRELDDPTSDWFTRWIQYCSRTFRWPAVLTFLLGLAVIGVGPYGYYVQFNKYVDRISDKGWNGSGLQWVPMYNAGRDGPDLLRYAQSAFLTGWEGPKKSEESQVRVRTLRLLTGGFWGIVGFAALGLLPWPRRAIALVAPANQNGEAPRRTIWRRLPPWPVLPLDALSTLWLILWIAVPTYAFYCMSMRGYASPGDWITLLQDVWRQNTWPKIVVPVFGVACFLLCGRTWTTRLLRLGQFAIVVTVAMLVLHGTFNLYGWLDAKLTGWIGPPWKMHNSLWIPRYLGFTVPAILVVLAVLFARLPTRLLRTVAVAVFVIVNLGQFGGRVFAGSEPPVDRMVADAVTWKQNVGTVKMFYDVRNPRMSAGMGPGTGVLHMPPARFYWLMHYPDPTVGPEDVRGFMGRKIDVNFPRQPFGPMASAVKRDVQQSPKLAKLIVWESLDPKKIDLTDKVLDALGPEWKRESDELLCARDHWTWKEMFTCRRRVYVKITASPAPVPVPTTTPTTAPTSAPSTQSVEP